MKELNNDGKQIIYAITVLCIFIVTIIISIILLYNQLLQIENRKPLFNLSIAIDINLINNIVVTILTLFFLYSNYTSNQRRYYNLRLTSSLLDIISACIVLYIAIDVYKNKNEFI